MTNVTATTGVDQFTGTGTAGNTSSSADEILITAQTQIQSGDLFDGGVGTDTLRLGASINFTSVLNGATSGIRNIEILQFNGAQTATFRSDQFGAGLLASNLTLQGTTGAVQTIVINMVSTAPTLNMSAWQFNNWTGGTDIISVVGSTSNDTILVSSQHTRFDGGSGSDTVDFSSWGGGFTLTLNGSNWVTATWNSGLTDQFRNVENIIGSTSADTITGDALNNRLVGGGGDDTLSSGGGNDTLDGGAGNDTMTGGVGNDTFTVDSALDVVVERATDAGTDLVNASVTFSAAGTNQDGIENITLTGTANIDATGNARANALTGNSGDNVLDGGAGADTMTGGAGNDTYTVDSSSDVVVELSSNTGTDLVNTSVTFSAAGTNQSGVENITLTGTANINATGNALNNVLTGNAGNNALNGGTGADNMTGGVGNDTYTVDNAGDVVLEYSSDTGTDLVNSSVTFSAAGANQSGIENITLTGTANISATGNGLDNILIGNSGANILIGGDGNDTLNGGSGADSMTGGVGNDTYTVDNAGDLVIELSTDTGTDLVNASVTFSAAGTNQSGIENITLTGTANINATGNALNNVLTGNTGNNALNGGAGADTMTGGAGNDTYTVDNLSDVVVELSSNAGTDLVNASVTFSAADSNQSGIENITLTGTANINATGNGLNNILIGNSGANILIGGDGNDTLNGGAGADTMTGGVGNDTYTVDNAGDVVVELSTDAGTDLVNASVTFSASGTNRTGIENITLTGTANINATGNGLDNILIGNSGANVLIGGDGNDTLNGGTGNDSMTGGVGNDTFYVDSTADVVIDRVTDLGTDLVYSTVTFSAAGTNQDGIENITLTGTANINATGNALDNTLVGNSGNNVLDGGLGADRMTGGAGNDTYYVDNVSDLVIEISSDVGTDLVFSSLTFSAAGVNQSGIENITLTGTSAIDAMGNALANALTGNSANNILSGGDGNDILIGGLGSDTLTGGSGADIFAFSPYDPSVAQFDVVTDFSIADGDRISLGSVGPATFETTANWLIRTDASGNTILNGFLASNTQRMILPNVAISDLTASSFIFDTSLTPRVLTGGNGNNTLFGGLGEDILTGGNLNNILVGDAGNDTLVGKNLVDVLDGGTGADSMTGGLGNDWYYVDNVGDVVNEADPSQGIDRVYSTISFSLTGTAAGIDDAFLTGTVDVDLVGNGLANRLTGNSGNNVLDGGAGNDVLDGGLGNDTLIGGAGNDTLTGGGGQDVFVFSGTFNQDTIQDFSAANDRLDLRSLGIDSAAELAPYASNSGSNLVLNFGGGNVVVMNGVQVSQIHDGMFVV
jgi:Ca2+-binding RTX toxin-like protein